ncbi:MAG: ABC transporter ATP-binding protein [Candidatus Korobacteraceae bacterium]
MKLLEVNGLCKSFGGVAALAGVVGHSIEGETLGMIGPNGSGKTTFVNVVSGHVRADSGTLTFAGVNIARMRPHQLAEVGLCRTYQAVRVFSELSTRQNIEDARLLLKDRGLGAAEVRELTEWLRLDRKLDKPAGSLTLFEQRRLELLMRLVLKPRLIMLDEPVGGLAVTEVSEMIALLQELKSRCSLFVIEHTMRVIRELADRVMVLITGEKVADGPPAEILQNQRVIDEYLGNAAHA